MIRLPPDLTILIAGEDEFESRYVASALIACGAPVMGPIRTGSALGAALDSGPQPAAVILGSRLVDGCCWELMPRLRERGIAHLVLLCPGDEEDRDLEGVAVLRRPFGA